MLVKGGFVLDETQLGHVLIRHAPIILLGFLIMVSLVIGGTIIAMKKLGIVLVSNGKNNNKNNNQAPHPFPLECGGHDALCKVVETMKMEHDQIKEKTIEMGLQQKINIESLRDGKKEFRSVNERIIILTQGMAVLLDRNGGIPDNLPDISKAHKK